MQVSINLVLIGYLIGSPVAAPLGWVSLYSYIETNVGVKLHWGSSAPCPLLARYATSRLTAVTMGLGAALIHVFAR